MGTPRAQSPWMALFRRLGLDSVAWSLRRLHCPVDPEALVLEVGSGGNPYFRANVLVDAHEDTRQRHWAKLVRDRPTVIGLAENLPFKSKAFDFVIASHVLEHSAEPARFLSELQRVARAGYIEVPDALMERLNPYLDHRLEITVREGRLIIRKKRAWQQDPELVELYARQAGAVIAGETIPRHPFHFHVRYYWSGSIDYVVLNPDVDAAWQAPSGPPPSSRRDVRQVVKSAMLWLLRLLCSQRRRNKALDLARLLRCPACQAEAMDLSATQLMCASCKETYVVKDGMPRLAVQPRK